ncbi:DUF3152 domain-containing protein [Streptomyces cavernicola]|uniref:DUF3152 domain-containing protein n=1 Tax=Streptomyces cavernicola TaxID=3043613 RepID=A0ABT6SK05_9ACTN|nr:DUF3152 domain-containing protein [Streptomyces sp. B-S-A6]MDI3407753.1 DUF3152 domain-containing protein [Streptomyces sp. B-S-A6]
MGRHSRRGGAEQSDTGAIPVAQPAANPGPGRRRRSAQPQEQARPQAQTAAQSAAQAPARTQARPQAQAVRGRGARPVSEAPRPHPEHREQGGAWGESGTPGYVSPNPAVTGAQPRVPGPRREYVAAFDGLDPHDGPDSDDVFAAGAPRRRPAGPGDPYDAVTDRDHEAADGPDGGQPDAVREKSGKARTVTGIAAAAVTTVLAVLVAVQLTGGDGDARPGAVDAGEVREQAEVEASASRDAERPPPSEPKPQTYEQKMGEKYPLAADLEASGEFEAIGGFEKAPGPGQKFRYRVDVEKGLGLDGKLFAQAVQKTLNDERSWAHGGGRTFERISSGKPDFVITLASPGTTGVWCAKSGLDTTVDNVSCDSAATERVMVNAYRWAQGAKTYGDAIHPYRQMLINHEVGHRLGFNHVMCSKDGALAPVMQQQTKFLEYDGVKCRPNAWAFPGN